MPPHDLPFPDVADWIRDYCDPARSRCLCGRDLRGEPRVGKHGRLARRLPRPRGALGTTNAFGCRA
ncbi:MAG TPA: hypothetical protein PKJ03_11060 [Methanoregulaceae archaeon]|nr:hypothetical protein [Methanoregulaceae archaeon]